MSVFMYYMILQSFINLNPHLQKFQGQSINSVMQLSDNTYTKSTNAGAGYVNKGDIDRVIEQWEFEPPND